LTFYYTFTWTVYHFNFKILPSLPPRGARQREKALDEVFVHPMPLGGEPESHTFWLNILAR
jgi:hypothetical protein